ncbi:MAG TPA: hypothetical protein VNQ14_11145 [Woeseiaceae bacterium]|nr:hypothetical protein [Woeseiaceae bacterium]
MLSHRLWLSVAVTIGCLASVAEGHEGNTKAIDELVVYGRAQPQVGIATSASAGFVGYDDIKLPPLLRAGELVEAVPGMAATQHSGTGKANQYFLRGSTWITARTFQPRPKVCRSTCVLTATAAP